MNRQECDVLNSLLENPYPTQRELAENVGRSLGSVNQSVKNLQEAQFITKDLAPTSQALDLWNASTPRNAIILAAGYGMRMVPINTEIPKGLIEVYGQPLIERLIEQLHAVGVTDITIVVGFMKERFEYLIDKYGVELVVNPEYATKNNLYSLELVEAKVSDSYIIPSDLWCAENPFAKHELYSWYMMENKPDPNSWLRINRKQEVVSVQMKQTGHTMIGISYLRKEDAEILKKQMRTMCKDPANEDAFWENALCLENFDTLAAKVVSEKDVIEIDTYEQLRTLDPNSAQVRSKTIDIAAEALSCQQTEITNITVLKKGMTNRSFLFECRGRRYIMRIPGEGTEHLINRRQEAQVYQTIRDKDICDTICYIDPSNGYKITEYLENARSCDAFNPDDVQKCMKRLRDFHALNLKVDHEFDIFGKIDFYESLWEGAPSMYQDYEKTKQRVFSLKSYIDEHVETKVLTHIDAVPDNFLIRRMPDGTEDIRLIDWEYAAMQDPHVDIAMFCIYAMYNREQVEQLIDAYFVEGCTKETRIKIYCYIAACGLLWSNWCEYKSNLGVEFGEYSLKQYRYAKDYYKIAMQEMQKL